MYIFTNYRKAKREAYGLLQFIETTGHQAAKGGFAVIFMSICWI